MAIFEEKTLIHSGDTLGNEVIHYPVTKSECVIGLDEALDELKETLGSIDVELESMTGILPIANGGTGNTVGRAVTANSLTTARTVQTNLASTSSASFNGSANITPGVTGTLPIARGGTGATTAAGALLQLTATNALAMGLNAGVGIVSTAVGGYANALGENSIAAGGYSSASGTNSTAIGRSSTASGSGSVAVGRTAVAGADNTIAIGWLANAPTLGSTAVGYFAKALSNNSTALGTQSNASGPFTTALGGYATASGNNSAAFGYNSQALERLSIAVGYNAVARMSEAVAIGVWAAANGGSATAVGPGAAARGDYSAALGIFATASGASSIALGYYATATTANTMQLGNASRLSTLSCRVALTVTSDERDKIDIVDTTKSLEFLSKIRTVTYKFNHRENYHSDVEVEEKEPKFDENGEPVPVVLSADVERKEKVKEKRHKFGIYDYDKEEHAKGKKKGSRGRIGVLAQQVQEAMIEVYGGDNYADLITDSMHDTNTSEIEEGMENTLGVNYSAFIPILIDAVKELNNRVLELEGKR